MGSDFTFKAFKYFLAEKPRNGLYKGKEFQGSGSRWIKMNEVFSLNFISNDDTSEKLQVTESEIERFSCKTGDLLFGRTSLTLEGVGDCLLIQNVTDAPIFESNLFRIRFDPNKAYPLFFYYFFKSHYGRQIIQRIAKQTAATSITATDLIEENVPNFSLEEQVTIADLIYQFDRKASLNKQTNQTLEKMAQTLFKSWFVDFDPVFDNALAKVEFNLENLPSAWPEALLQRATSRLQVLQLNPALQAKLTQPNPVETQANTALEQASPTENTHQHFPSEFEHNEQLGWIPKGWEFGQIATHAHVEMGQSPKGDTYNDNGIGTPLVNGPVEFGPYFTKKSKWTTAPTKLSKKGDLIVCVRGSTTGRFVKSDGEYCLGRGVCSIRGKKYQVFTDQLFKHSIREMLGLTTGSTFPNWSRQTLSEFKSIVPSDKVLQIFEGLVTPKINKVEAGVIESESLTKLRDTLLPKLITGELKIP